MPFLAKSGENICKYGSFVVTLPNKFGENGLHLGKKPAFCTRFAPSLPHKTTKINDQRMKINEVIERHGMQLRDVSREMGMKPSALQSAIDRNLTVKTLRQISEAARIPIAEFFFDELKSDPKWVERILDILTDTDRQQLLAALQPEQHNGDGSDVLSQANAHAAPSPAPSASIQQAIICPHCKKAMTITVQA